MKTFWKYAKIGFLIYSQIFIVLNWYAFGGLFHFIRTFVTYEYQSTSPISKQGDYAEMFDLINLDSQQRVNFISSRLDSLNVKYRIDSISSNESNIFVFGDTSKEISIITAHHDILERENYQGALDNTGSVNILLNLCEMVDFDDKPLGILFTGLEERGLQGAKHFIGETSKALKLNIKEVICLDGVGKGKLAVMNNGAKFGFYFRNLLFRKKNFNGKYFQSSAEYTPYPTNIIDLKDAGIIQLKSFVSSTDSKVFVDAGIPSLQLVSSNIYHFLSVLHTTKDRIETIDQSSLKQCENILMNYVNGL